MDIRLNIHLTYTGIRWISDRIFIWCMQGLGGFPTEYSFSLTEYSFDVHRDQAD
jgi:hypothetical protein